MDTHKTRIRRRARRREIGAKHCYTQSVQTHGDEDEEAERVDRGRGI
jgi:hypothetical protein